MYSASEWLSGGDFYLFNSTSANSEKPESHRVFYRAGGAVDRPVLVLLHGFPTSSWDWHLLWDALCKNFRVVCFDFLGFGESDKPLRHRYQIAEQADIAEALIVHLGVGQFHILAHDYGDTVAQELLARDNARSVSRILTVVLTNGGLFPETHRPVFLQKLLLSPIGGLIARLASFKRFRANFDYICKQTLSEDQLQAHWRLLTKNKGRAVMAKLIGYMLERQRNRERWVGALQVYGGDIFLVSGVDDPISGEHMVQRYEQLVATTNILRLKGVGHYPQLEAPRQVLDAVLECCGAYAGTRLV